MEPIESIQQMETIDPLSKASSALTHFQVEIITECLNKGTGGLSLPMGSGKTLISIVNGLNLVSKPAKQADCPHNAIILVVVSKSLITNWETEIHKFFEESLPYEILHTDNLKTRIGHWTPKPTTRLVLTTAEVVGKYYKDYEVSKRFISQFNINPLTVVNNYNRPTKPFLNHLSGGGLLYSVKWGCLIVDEAQKYTNANTDRCQGLGSICAEHRWALSGTLFDEPKAERVLGYHLMLDMTPRTLPDTVKLITSPSFKGVNSTLVKRDKNNMFQNPPQVNEKIVAHDLTPHEAKVYLVLKNTLNTITERIDQLKLVNDTEAVKRFSSYLLALITYLRQSLVCPIIPLASIAIDMADYENRSKLSEILTEEVNKIGLFDWLNNIESVKSSRITEVINRLNAHKDERIVLFSCFRTCLDVLKTYIPTDREIFNITSDMSLQNRGKVVDAFRNSKNGVLLLTYELGAEGLNLQCASTALLLDFWWNSSKTQQAIARVVRFGQKASVVNVYFFTSNTGVEQAIFKKHKSKLLLLEELKVGPCTTKIHKMTMKEILELIQNSQDNMLLLQDIQNTIKNPKPPSTPTTTTTTTTTTTIIPGNSLLTTLKSAVKSFL